jgi:hypothetical protein
MGILEDFYRVIADENNKQRVHIPHSSVFYVRSAIEARTGVYLQIPEVENLLYEEGLLPAKDYKIPLWYRRKYLDPKEPAPQYSGAAAKEKAA